MSDFFEYLQVTWFGGEGGKFDICRLDHSGLGQLLFS